MPQILDFLQQSGVRVDQEIVAPSWGQGRLRVFRGGERQYVLKSMGHSSLRRLSQPLLIDCLDALHACTRRLLLPDRCGQGYFLDVDGEPSMLFPWVGPWNAQPCRDLAISEHILFLAELDEELAQVPQPIIESLVKELCRIRGLSSHLEQNIYKCRALLTRPLEDLLLKACKVWANISPTTSRFTKLAHTDLHASNLVKRKDGQLVAIDIDSIRVGDNFTDLVFVLAYRGADSQVLNEQLSLYREHRSRNLPNLDINAIYMGVVISVSHLVAISQKIEKLIAYDMSKRFSSEGWRQAVDRISEERPQLGGALKKVVPRLNRGLSTIIEHALREPRP